MNDNILAIAMPTQLGNISLPDTATPEQLERAEPILVKMIIEDEETGYSDGIQPLAKVETDPGQNEYIVTGPGTYEGIFTDRDEDLQFKFEILDGESVYTLHKGEVAA